MFRDPVRDTLCMAPIANLCVLLPPPSLPSPATDPAVYSKLRMCLQHAKVAASLKDKTSGRPMTGEPIKGTRKFPHGLEEWLDVPDTWRTMMCGSSSARRLTRGVRGRCGNVSKGIPCKFGHTCAFAHTIKDLRHKSDPMPSLVFVPRQGESMDPPVLVPEPKAEAKSLRQAAADKPDSEAPAVHRATSAAGEDCLICNDALADALLVPCQHRMCQACVRRWRGNTVMNKSAGTPCPFCRETVTRIDTQASSSAKPSSAWARPDARDAVAYEWQESKSKAQMQQERLERRMRAEQEERARATAAEQERADRERAEREEQERLLRQRRELRDMELKQRALVAAAAQAESAALAALAPPAVLPAPSDPTPPARRYVPPGFVVVPQPLADYWAPPPPVAHSWAGGMWGEQDPFGDHDMSSALPASLGFGSPYTLARPPAPPPLSAAPPPLSAAPPPLSAAEEQARLHKQRAREAKLAVVKANEAKVRAQQLDVEPELGMSAYELELARAEARRRQQEEEDAQMARKLQQEEEEEAARRRRSAAPQPAPARVASTGFWTCSVCTFDNQSAFDKCAMCMCARP